MATRQRNGEAWTGDEDAFIEARWGSWTDREIARALGRTEVGVTSRRGALRFLRAQTGDKGEGTRHWAQEEDEMLSRLFEAGEGDREIAVTLGRTMGAVAQRRSALGLRRIDQPPDLVAVSAWAADDDDALGWMFRHGWSDERIGESMERTATAVKDRRQSLSLWRVPRR